LIASSRFNFIARYYFWFWVSSVLMLGWLGQQPIAYPYTEISQCLIFVYFSFFFMWPFLGYYLNAILLYEFNMEL
jgi:hypothetical protein